MKKFYRDQSGFSTTETVLLVVVVLVIGAAGWVVYDKNHKSTTTMNTGASLTVNLVKIPALGIEMTVPSTIKDLTFYDNPSTYAEDLSTASLASLDKSCTANSSSDTANSLALGELDSPSAKDVNTVAQLQHNGEGSQYVYIDYIQPTRSCTNDIKTLAVLDQYRADFINSLGSIKLIQ